MRRRPTPVLVLVLGLALLFCAPLIAQDHDPRLHTNREQGRQLIKLPKEADAFGFVIFGDRTSGKPSGLKFLEQAVTDTNLLDPDLVMTVGDLIQGYTDTPEWLRQANEYKAIVNKLRMPWFPVAGNHDVYFRGENRPPREHEQNYEMHFGPLWYAFQHKKCWFVVLYSDEGNLQTGKKDFSDPECQRMSPEQFTWLQETLQKAKGAQHVFLFLHHPRWLTARYGDDWDRVHKALVAAGNVRAVFAGHIHRMRYDGVQDGIEYFTLAATGANIDFEAPQAGYLHEFHVVTVRPEGIQLATVPVGTVMDPRLVTGQVSEDAAALHRGLQPTNVRGATVARDGGVNGVVEFELSNPAKAPIELEILPAGEDWAFLPDHTHQVIEPGATGKVSFQVRRPAGRNDTFAMPQLALRCDYLGEGIRFKMPEITRELALAPSPDVGVAETAVDAALDLSGKDACLEIAAAALQLHDGAFTVEAWCSGTDFSGRRALLAKTESSEWSLMVSDGTPSFSVHLGGSYVTVKGAEKSLQPGRWYHIAGMFDGNQVALFVDGARVIGKQATGRRTTNNRPLFVGADPNSDNKPVSQFAGRIDEVRISDVARYLGERFEPERRFETDAQTVLLLHLDADHGPWTPDSSPRKTHPRRRGGAVCAPFTRGR